MSTNIKCLNGNMLKWIAIITMVIDHTAHVLVPTMFPEYTVMRYIGRLAFPIFCFLLVEGFLHTSDVKKYLIRMLIFALVAEIPFDLALSGQAFYWGHQNVFWTLFLGLLVMYLIQTFPAKWMIPVAGIGGMLIAHLLSTDYGAGGVLLIFVFYYLKDRPLLKYVIMALLMILGYGGSQIFSLVAIIPMLLYNGQRGRYSMKWFFYVFYPAHLIVLFVLYQLIY